MCREAKSELSMRSRVKDLKKTTTTKEEEKTQNSFPFSFFKFCQKEAALFWNPCGCVVTVTDSAVANESTVATDGLSNNPRPIYRRHFTPLSPAYRLVLSFLILLLEQQLKQKSSSRQHFTVLFLKFWGSFSSFISIREKPTRSGRVLMSPGQNKGGKNKHNKQLWQQQHAVLVRGILSLINLQPLC